MELKAKRHPLNPILSPNPNHLWESRFVFNCAVAKKNGLFHMLYRAQGEDMVSRIGYAVSVDGISSTDWKSLCSLQKVNMNSMV